MKNNVINNRVVLTADEGKIVTDGAEIYGKEVVLAVGLTAEEFYEITEEEYQAMQPKVEEEVLC